MTHHAVVEQDQHQQANAASSAAAIMDPSEAIDRIVTMRFQEESESYRCVNYLAYAARNYTCGAAEPGEPPIDSDCRYKMCLWSEQVVDFCQFSRETVSVAMNYLDRFLTASVTTDNAAASRCRVSRREYQLAAMTALYIAVKLNEPLEMDTELVSELSRGCYSAQEVADMEVDILDALGWRTSGPTPLEFLHHFLALLPPSGNRNAVAEELLDLARCQTELAVGDYGLVTLNASTIAVASLMNSLEPIGNVMTSAEKIVLLRRVRDASGVDLVTEEVRYARRRLREALGGDSQGEGEAETEQEAEAPQYETEEPELQQEESQQVDVKKEQSGKRTRRFSMPCSPTCVSKR